MTLHDFHPKQQEGLANAPGLIGWGSPLLQVGACRVGSAGCPTAAVQLSCPGTQASRSF